MSEVFPLCKKLNKLLKENYRLVSLIPHVSRVFERAIYRQITIFMKDNLANCLTGYKKTHGTNRKRHLINENIYQRYLWIS